MESMLPIAQSAPDPAAVRPAYKDMAAREDPAGPSFRSFLAHERRAPGNTHAREYRDGGKAHAELKNDGGSRPADRKRMDREEASSSARESCGDRPADDTTDPVTADDAAESGATTSPTPGGGAGRTPADDGAQKGETTSTVADIFRILIQDSIDNYSLQANPDSGQANFLTGDPKGITSGSPGTSKAEGMRPGGTISSAAEIFRTIIQDSIDNYSLQANPDPGQANFLTGYPKGVTSGSPGTSKAEGMQPGGTISSAAEIFRTIVQDSIDNYKSPANPDPVQAGSPSAAAADVSSGMETGKKAAFGTVQTTVPAGPLFKANDIKTADQPEKAAAGQHKTAASAGDKAADSSQKATTQDMPGLSQGDTTADTPGGGLPSEKQKAGEPQSASNDARSSRAGTDHGGEARPITQAAPAEAQAFRKVHEGARASGTTEITLPGERHVVVTRSTDRAIEVSVDPDGIGKIDIELRLDGGQVSGRINAADAVGKELVERNLQNIMASLSREGISVGGFSVSLRNRQPEAQSFTGTAEADADTPGAGPVPAARAAYGGSLSIFV